MDAKATNNAVAVSGFPENVCKWIWEEEKKAGVHFDKPIRRVIHGR